MLNPIQQEIAPTISKPKSAALHTKLAIPVQPTKLETLTVNDHEEVDSIVVLIGDITGVIPAYNAGLTCTGAELPGVHGPDPDEKRPSATGLFSSWPCPNFTSRSSRSRATPSTSRGALPCGTAGRPPCAASEYLK